MKEYFYFFVFCISTFGFINCSSSQMDPKDESIDFHSLDIIKKDATEFPKLAKIKKIIKLETTDYSLLSELKKVMVDKEGDIYVLDDSRPPRLLKFDKDGKFKKQYGRVGSGPGEYNDFLNFTVDTGNNVILLTPIKFIKFKKNGDLIKEKRVNFLGMDIISLFKSIYVYTCDYRHAREAKKSVLIFDPDLIETGGLFPFDTKLEKYKFLNSNNLAQNGANLFYIDNYDFRLQMYDPQKNTLIKLDIPNGNKDLESIWNKGNFTEADRTEIKNKINRFSSIYAVENTLFLTERCKSRKIFNYWLLNLEKRKAIIFSYNWDEWAAGKLFSLRIIGSYDKGFIVSFLDPDELNWHKKDYPFLKDIEMAMEDNPLLVYLEFDKDIWD